MSNKTPAEELWDEIKNKAIGMFGLPNKKVQDFCSFKNVEPSKLYLDFNISSFLPALEEALGKNYVVNLEHKFITVDRKRDY